MSQISFAASNMVAEFLPCFMDCLWGLIPYNLPGTCLLCSRCPLLVQMFDHYAHHCRVYYRVDNGGCSDLAIM